MESKLWKANDKVDNKMDNNGKQIGKVVRNMKTNVKCKIVKRNKKHNYKVYEEEKYNAMSGYEYSYFIMDYAEDNTIASGLINWNMVQEQLNILER